MLVAFTEEEVNVLRDVLDWWLDDYDAATTDVLNDKSFDTPEQMLKAYDGMTQTFDLVTRAKGKLDASRAPSTV